MSDHPSHPFDWKILRSRHVLKDRWISVRADTCQMPSGRVIDPFYVLEYPDYINVVAITPQQEVILIREYRHGIGQTIIGMPSGRVDAGETPLQAAQRELLEETGFAGAEWRQLCELYPNPGSINNRVFSFLAQGVTPQESARWEDSEQIEVLLTPLEKVIDMLARNQIVQAMHTSALFYAVQQLKNGG